MKTSLEEAWDEYSSPLDRESIGQRLLGMLYDAFEAGFEAGREAALEYPDLFERGEPS